MIKQIYKISVWKEKRIAEVDCKIYTEDIAQTLIDLRSMDFGVDMDDESKLHVRWIERPDMSSTSMPVFNFVNKAKEKELEKI